MKKILFVALVFCAFQIQAQYVDGIPMSNIDYEFVQIRITSGETQKIVFDYGQDDPDLYDKTNLTNATGKEINPVSHVPLINKMIEMGYDVLSINHLSSEGEQTLLYSFRKKKK